MRGTFVGVLMVLAAVGCSSLDARYLKAGYDSTAAGAVKHITVVSVAPDVELARLLGRIASERVKLKMNYLVYDEQIAVPGWSSGCTLDDENAEQDEDREIDGVLALQVLEDITADNEVEFTIEGRLMRCRDGALLWRAQVTDSASSNDDDLESFAESFRDEFPAQAPRAAIPLLVSLIDLLEALPDVVLNEDEEIMKIELS
ncbi:MAG: MXAN_6521/LA_1396 family lipoprotein [Myxococcota bacterium]